MPFDHQPPDAPLNPLFVLVGEVYCDLRDRRTVAQVFPQSRPFLALDEQFEQVSSVVTLILVSRAYQAMIDGRQ